MRERNHFIGVWLDDKEYAYLNQLCETSGLSASGLLRQVLAGVQLRPRPPDEYTHLLRELSAIGNNVNQIGRSDRARSDQPSGKHVSSQQQEYINLLSARCRILSLQVSDKQQEIADYESETIKVIRGQSRFSAELLTSLSAKAKDELEELKTALEAAQEELDALQADEATDNEEYVRLIGWADIYDRCSFETKKMFVSKFIKAVRVFRDYRLEIDFNVSYEEFRNLTVQTAV